MREVRGDNFQVPAGGAPKNRKPGAVQQRDGEARVHGPDENGCGARFEGVGEVSFLMGLAAEVIYTSEVVILKQK